MNDWLPYTSLLGLKGRGAVVTGAARGVGRGIAERLAEAGATVVVADLDAEAASSAAKELRERWGGSPMAEGVDVTDGAAMHRIANRVVVECGSLDIWVNNAGIFPPAHPVHADRETFERILSVNVSGTHLGCQAAAAHMGTGVIVNVASTAAFRGAGAYSASKWAVRGMTEGLAARLGAQGIRVVGVAPTTVATPGLDAVLRGGGGHMAEVNDALIARLPLGRGAVPDDVARAVLFLVSDAASLITGVVVPVDGGELVS